MPPHARMLSRFQLFEGVVTEWEFQLEIYRTAMGEKKRRITFNFNTQKCAFLVMKVEPCLRVCSLPCILILYVPS